MASTEDRNPNRLADRVAGFDDPSMGDERERDVMLRASSYGMQVSLYLFMAGGFVFAAIGTGLWSVLPILAGAVPSLAMLGYARREHVDPAALAELASPSRRVLAGVVAGAAVLLWGGAVAFHAAVGRPLMPVTLGVTPPDTSPATLLGLAVGAVVGLGVAVGLHAVQRGRRHSAVEDGSLDEED